MEYTKKPPKNQSKQLTSDSSSSKKAFEVALWYLSRSERTKKELNDKLLRRDFFEEQINEALGKLEKLGFIDDFRYARNFISNSFRGKAKGRRRIVFELKRKGVGEDDIARAIEECWLEDESELAQNEAVKAVYKNRLQTREKNFSRSVAYLIRRGFSYDDAKKAVSRSLDELLKI